MDSNQRCDYRGGVTVHWFKPLTHLHIICCMPRAHLLSSSRFRILYTGCRSLPVQHSFGRTYGFRTRFSALKGRRPSPRSPMSHSLVVPDRLELSLRAYETQVRTVRCHQLWRSVCESNTLLCSAMELQSIPLPSGPPTNLFDASYIAIASLGCYTSCSKCVLSTLCNLPLCTLRREFVEQGHLLVCLTPVGLLVPTLENPSFRSRIKFR